MRHYWIGWVAALSLVATACNRKDTKKTEAEATATGSAAAAPAEDPKVDVEASDEIKNLAGELAPQAKDNEFSHALKKQENAKAFVYLAAQHDDKGVVAAALDAMADAFGQGKEPLNDDYKKVVRARLGSGHGATLGGALRAARHMGTSETKDDEVYASVAKIVTEHPNPVARYEALDIVTSLSESHQDARLVDAMLKATDAPQNFVQSHATYALSTGTFDLKHRRDEVFAKAKQLMDHADPGVRGRAIDLASRIAKDDRKKDEVVPAIEKKLDDSSPFVKSMAARALAHLQAAGAMDKIVALLSDTSKNVYLIELTSLSGKGHNVVHDGSNYSRVDDAMIWTIRDFSNTTDTRFEPGKREDGLSVDGWVEREGKRAKEWVAQNRSKLQR